MSKFQSFWFGDHVPPYQRLAMKSFIDHGHEYVLYAYKAFDVPAGVVVRDANEILPESRVFFYDERAGDGRGSVAAFANLFRYHLLHRTGDWWVDADVVCLSGAIPATPTFMGWEYDDLIGNAILKFPAQDPLVQALRDATESMGSDIAWGMTGPGLLTRLARERNLLDQVAPQAMAYPVQSRDALHLSCRLGATRLRRESETGLFCTSGTRSCDGLSYFRGWRRHREVSWRKCSHATTSVTAPPRPTPKTRSGG